MDLLIPFFHPCFSAHCISILHCAEAAHVSITAFATKPIFRAPAAAPMRPAASAPSIPSSVAYQPSLWQPVTPSSEPTVAMPTDRLPWEKPYEPQQPSKPAQSPVFRFLVSLSCAVEWLDHRGTSVSWSFVSFPLHSNSFCFIFIRHYFTLFVVMLFYYGAFNVRGRCICSMFGELLENKIALGPIHSELSV